MPEADSTSILSNPSGRSPQIATQPAQKPKFLDRFREALRLHRDLRLLKKRQPLNWTGDNSLGQNGLRKWPSCAEFRTE